MTELLIRLLACEFRQQEFILHSLSRSINGRIRRLLPPEVPVYNKTGTLGDTVVDAGFITLPEGKGTLILSCFVQNAEMSLSEKEQVLAQCAKEIYDNVVNSEPLRI